jgi:YgiT-type zinc finger domain-containing protein
MNCLDCKHGVPEGGKVTVSFDKDNCTVVIKDVPALVCPVCGAYYLDEEITQKVMDLGSAAVKKGAEVEVIHLQAA